MVTTLSISEHEKSSVVFSTMSDGALLGQLIYPDYGSQVQCAVVLVDTSQ